MKALFKYYTEEKKDGDREGLTDWEDKEKRPELSLHCQLSLQYDNKGGLTCDTAWMYHYYTNCYHG